MAESKTKNPYKTAVDDLCLTAKKGEIYGLLGPNGAGKTTTLRCIATLIKPTKGEVFVDQHEVQKEPEKVRESIGFLTSEIKLDEQFDVDYMFDFFGKLHNISGERLKKRKEELFTYFGIKEFAHKKIKELSTGMKQKAAIAVSLVHDPDIVIFDEPTNGLDIPGKSQFRKFIASGMSDDKTIVISTHQVRDIDKVLDHVLIMDDSRVLLDESTSNICDKLFFVESDNRELAKNALFAIPTIQGNYLILPNEEQEESELNLELLFNATLAAPEEMARLFQTQK